MEHVARLPLASVKDTPLNSIVALLALILSMLVSELECALGEMPIMVLIARLIKIVVVDAVAVIADVAGPVISLRDTVGNRFATLTAVLHPGSRQASSR